MTHRVKLSQVFDPYANYMRHAFFGNARLGNVSQAEFEQHWLIDQGIMPVRCEQGDASVGYLEFRDRKHYLMWLLKWA